MNVWWYEQSIFHRSMAEYFSKKSHRSEYIRVFDGPNKVVFVDLFIPNCYKIKDDTSSMYKSILDLMLVTRAAERKK